MITPFITSVMQPQSYFKFGDVEQVFAPIGPGVDYSGECVPWEIKNEYCIGDIRHYTQCQKTVAGGVWQPHSERCSDYGGDVRCVVGKCVKTSRVLLSTAISVLIFAVGVFIFIKAFKKKKRRK